jgi:hypothetical protein
LNVLGIIKLILPFTLTVYKRVEDVEEESVGYAKESGVLFV